MLLFWIFSVNQMSEVLILYSLSLILNFALLCYLFMFQVLLYIMLMHNYVHLIHRVLGRIDSPSAYVH